MRNREMKRMFNIKKQENVNYNHNTYLGGKGGRSLLSSRFAWPILSESYFLVKPYLQKERKKKKKSKQTKNPQ